jgi:hypothetical protein
MRLELSSEEIWIIGEALTECQYAATSENDFESASEYRRLAMRMRMYLGYRKEESENTFVRVKKPRVKREVRRVPKKSEERRDVLPNHSK